MAKMLDNRGTTSKIFQIGRETALKSTDDSLEVVSAQFPAERKDFRANIATFEGLVLPNALLNASDNRFSKNPISNGYELVYGDKRIVITVEQATGEVVVLSNEAAGTLGNIKADTATFTNLNLPNATMNAENNTFSKDPISKGYVLSDEGKNSTLSIDQSTGMVESSSGMGIKNSGYVSNCILGFKAPAFVSGMTITMPAGFNINYSDGRDLYDEASNPGGIGALKSYNSITDTAYTVTVSPTGEDETVSFYVLYDDTAKELFYVSKDQLYYGIKVPTVEDGYLVRRDSNGNDYYRLIDGVWVKRHIIRVASFDLVDGKTMDNFEPCYPCDLLKLTDYLVADSGGGGSQQAAVRSMEIPASDSETSSIALDYACYDKNAMLVLIEHTVVPPTTYELSSNGKTLTFNTPIPAGMRIDLRWFSNIEVVKVDIPLASDTEFMQGTSEVLAPTVKQVHQYNGTKLPLFYPSRFPWVANNIEWLRADTFSWQSGKVYSAAYAELVSIYNAEGGSNETETIGAYTITYKRCANGMKIADATQQNVIMNIYAATGSAFYFILDLGNSRFKLPRTKYSLVGYEDGLGNYVSSEAATGNGVKVAGIQSYLYFYMGTYNQSAIDNTAGLNTELFAGKADVDYVKNNYVDLNTVQTISAQKIFTSEQQKKSTVIDITTQPENYTPNNAFRFLDKNDQISGWIENAQMASGEITTGIHARNKDGYQPRVSVFVPLTGMTGAYAIAPITPEDAPIDAIATKGYVQNKFDAKANRGLDNSPYTTNRILEIPQDIKLELSDGTLTLKAGSKVYVPNGAGTFNAITIASDVSTQRQDSQDCIAWYNTDNGTIQLFPSILFYSGTTAPSGYQFMFWYDTTSNKCKVTSNSGSTWVEGKSFPICVVSTDGTKVSAIKQVFNGFGYIGSTVFALPGVKVQIPNGRNADGTCKAILTTLTSVKTQTFTDAARRGWYLQPNGASSGNSPVYSDTQPSQNYIRWFSSKDNQWYDTHSSPELNSETYILPLAVFNTDSTGKITSFEPYTVDSLLNSSLSNLSAAGRATLNGKASIDLNNLSSTGEAHFANPDLSNLSAAGRATLNGKASIDLNNLSSTGEAHFANPDLSNLSAVGKAALSSNSGMKTNLSNLDNTNNVAASNLNSKGIRTVVETYQNGANWYRIWSDGWIEQGGRGLSRVLQPNTLTLLKPFSNTNYFLTGSDISNNAPIVFNELKVDKFNHRLVTSTQISVGQPFSWYASGY